MSSIRLLQCSCERLIFWLTSKMDSDAFNLNCKRANASPNTFSHSLRHPQPKRTFQSFPMKNKRRYLFIRFRLSASILHNNSKVVQCEFTSFENAIAFKFNTKTHLFNNSEQSWMKKHTIGNKNTRRSSKFEHCQKKRRLDLLLLLFRYGKLYSQ